MCWYWVGPIPCEKHIVGNSISFPVSHTVLAYLPFCRLLPKVQAPQRLFLYLCRCEDVWKEYYCPLFLRCVLIRSILSANTLGVVISTVLSDSYYLIILWQHHASATASHTSILKSAHVPIKIQVMLYNFTVMVSYTSLQGNTIPSLSDRIPHFFVMCRVSYIDMHYTFFNSLYSFKLLDALYTDKSICTTTSSGINFLSPVAKSNSIVMRQGSRSLFP